MNSRKLRTPSRSQIRPPTLRMSTPKTQVFLPRASSSSQSEQQFQQLPLFDQDENRITLGKLYSNLLLLGMEYNQEYYQKYLAYIGNLRQFSIDNLLQSQELVRLITHFLIGIYELSLTQTQAGERPYTSDYLREIAYYFPPIGEKLTEYNRLVKNKFQQISTSHGAYPWPRIIPDPSCVHRFYLCLFYLSQLCLIKRLSKHSQIRFREMNYSVGSNQSINVGNNEKNGSITRDRLQRINHLNKCDTSRNYQMFYKKIADDYEKRNKFFQLKEELEQELEKLIHQYEQANLYSQQFIQLQQDDEPNRYENLLGQIREMNTYLLSDTFQKLDWFSKNYSSKLNSTTIEIGLNPTLCKQIKKLCELNQQQNVNKDLLSPTIVSPGSLIEQASNSPLTNPLYPTFTESSSSTTSSPLVSTFEIFQAGILCLQERFHTYKQSDENSKLCAQIVEQMNLTVKQTENILNSLTQLEQQKQYLSSAVPVSDVNITNYVNDTVGNGDTTGYSQIVTPISVDHDLHQCGHQGRVQLSDQLCRRPLNMARHPSSSLSFLNDSSSLTTVENITTIQGPSNIKKEEEEVISSNDLSFRQLETLLLGPNRTKAILNEDSFIKLENQLNNEEEIVDSKIHQQLTISPELLPNNAPSNTTLSSLSSIENDMNLPQTSTTIVEVPAQEQYDDEKENISMSSESIEEISIETKSTKFILPILTSPLRAQPELPKLLTQIESIDPY
ncbi:unnamed protein product [Didymodactylos carnosus]|uniref:Uncharacterized protein n=1 Tax=Didymodactylos carnosus TaxID=1234261 RepID=A0A8S2CVS8_9BILA|nr:unnamed protein product [Didymodactylos carnosus]CAF3516928.1 unnamed protein product [Didymodactylos carnosus]